MLMQNFTIDAAMTAWLTQPRATKTRIAYEPTLCSFRDSLFPTRKDVHARIEGTSTFFTLKNEAAKFSCRSHSTPPSCTLVKKPPSLHPRDTVTQL